MLLCRVGYLRAYWADCKPCMQVVLRAAWCLTICKVWVCVVWYSCFLVYFGFLGLFTWYLIVLFGFWVCCFGGVGLVFVVTLGAIECLFLFVGLVWALVAPSPCPLIWVSLILGLLDCDTFVVVWMFGFCVVLRGLICFNGGYVVEVSVMCWCGCDFGGWIFVCTLNASVFVLFDFVRRVLWLFVLVLDF